MKIFKLVILATCLTFAIAGCAQTPEQAAAWRAWAQQVQQNEIQRMKSNRIKTTNCTMNGNTMSCTEF